MGILEYQNEDILMGTFCPPKGDGVAEYEWPPNQNVRSQVGGIRIRIEPPKNRGHHGRTKRGPEKAGYPTPGVVGRVGHRRGYLKAKEEGRRGMNTG